MSARPVVFVGPTLAASDALEILDVECLPPVQLGDVWRVSQERPLAIGVVDGYFDRVPALWHKEVLYALSLGIPVYGAASMGALRAAELAAFGMTPVGAIAAAYLSGDLVSDDAVALVHADGDFGFRPFSEPLVNIRATLVAAVAERVVTTTTADALLATACDLFYAHRVWPRLLDAAPVPARDVVALRDWLPHGRVDQKRLDAIELLNRMRADLATAPSQAAGARPSFVRTVLWEQLVREETPVAGVLEEFLLTDPLPPAVATAIDRARQGEAVDWLTVLSSEPDWPERCARARRKRARCADAAPPVGPEEADSLLAWFLGDRLGWPQDLASFLRDRGWTEADRILRVAAREAAFTGGWSVS